MLYSKNVSNSLETLTPVFDMLDDGVIIISHHGGILYANPVILELIKHSKDDVINKNYLSISELNWLKLKLPKNRLINFSCSVCGKTFWFKVSSKELANKAVAYILRKEDSERSAKAIKLSNLRSKTLKPMTLNLSTLKHFAVLKDIFEGIDVGLTLFSHPDFKVIEVNNTYLNLMADNLSTRDIVGLSYKEYIKENDPSGQILKAWKENISTGQGFVIREVSFNTENGEKFFYYQVQPIKINGKIKYWLESLIDVTEHSNLRKEAVKLAKEKQEKINSFHSLLNSMNDGVLVIDKNERVIDANMSAIDLYGFNFHEDNNILVRKFFRKIKVRNVDGHPFDESDVVCLRALRGEVINNREALIQNLKTGEDLYVSLNASPIYDDDNEIEGSVLVIRNINSRILARKQREELIKLQDEFMAIISHELRTPVTVIYSALQTILSLYRKDLTPKLDTMLGKIKLNSLRLLKLINNLLDITKAQAGFIKPCFSNVDLVRLTESIVNLVAFYANSKGIRLIFSSSMGSKVIALDQDKYERILMNLLSNSIKFTPRGKDITVNIFRRKGNICISIKDCGIGIPKEQLESIFEKFVQVNNVLSRNHEGTGLGLSIVKTLVDSMNGKITAKSTPSVGSEFIISFPDVIVNDENEFSQSVGIGDHLNEKVNIEFSDLYLDAK